MFHRFRRISISFFGVTNSRASRRGILPALLFVGLSSVSLFFHPEMQAANPWMAPANSEPASEESSADDSGEWATATDPGPAYAKLPEIESHLYGHAYPNQALSRRLARVEQTLFGEIRHARSELRMQAIERQAQEERNRNQRLNHDPMLAYLENKLFQRTFERYLVPDRLHRLETHVFGQAFDALPTEVRLKKLTYALPLMTREIRLSRDDGQMIAHAVSPSAYVASRSIPNRTGIKTPEPRLLSAEGSRIAHRIPPAQNRSFTADGTGNHPAATHTAPFDPEPVQLDAGAFPAAFPGTLPSAVPASSSSFLSSEHSALAATVPAASFPVMHAVFEAGSYIQAIHRNPDGTVLRWKKLPVHVFVKPDSAQTALVQQAIASWRSALPVETVSDPNRSDIVISWEQDDWLNIAEGVVTSPVNRVDTQKKPHTVILISLYPLRTETEGVRLHALTHALGHALGLWGHSANPADIMSPWLELERSDFPERWALRSPVALRSNEMAGRMDDFQPTQRDIDTLLKIYDLPATDLKTDPLPL